MKRIISGLLLVSFVFIGLAMTDKEKVIKRGKKLGKSPQVNLIDVLNTPQTYVGKTYLVSGVIERVCQMEGCWMEIAPKAGEKTVRVTFKNHGFLVPKDVTGMTAKAEGSFEIKTMTKEQADHLEKEDGAKVNRNADGTANEIAFIALGVELTK